MVITDIVSLFTRIPVSKAFWVIEDLLTDVDTLKTQTNLLPANIVSLTRLVVQTVFVSMQKYPQKRAVKTVIAMHIPSIGREKRFLGGRAVGEEEVLLKPL